LDDERGGGARDVQFITEKLAAIGLADAAYIRRNQPTCSFGQKMNWPRAASEVHFISALRSTAAKLSVTAKWMCKTFCGKAEGAGSLDLNM
jgi:hypothetical protein